MQKPLSGAIWGLVLGIALAIVLQQQGIWPLDKLTVFLVPGAIGLIGVIITTVGRTGSASVVVVAVVITGAATAYGATGLGELDVSGYLDGGCEVAAVSDVDATTVDDTSKQDPFEIDPDGGLSWVATSPTVFDDYPWEIWVDVGGFPVTIDSEVSQDNDGGSQINDGDVPNVTEYAEARNIPIGQLRGVFEVGGFAASCDGLAFVKFTADPLETILAKAAAALAAIALLMLLRAALAGRGGGAVPGGTPGTELDDIGVAAPAADQNLDEGTPGDFDGDGAVEVEDHTTWRDSNGDDDTGYEPGSEDLPNPDDHA